jgi:hypothetical protein
MIMIVKVCLYLLVAYSPRFNDNDNLEDQDDLLDKSKTSFEEESKRFNNDYFKMFAQDKDSNQSKLDGDSGDDYEQDFEDIQEVISNVNDNASQRKSSVASLNKVPTELEENPYKYYANKVTKRNRKSSIMSRFLNESDRSIPGMDLILGYICF